MKVMKKLERMTLGHISELVEGTFQKKIMHFGKGVAKNTYGNNIKVSFSGRDIKYLTDYGSTHMLGNQEFLESLDNFLKQNNLYISEVEYSPSKAMDLFSHKIKGIFYEEISRK